MEEGPLLLALICGGAAVALLVVVLSQRRQIATLTESIQSEAERRHDGWKATELVELQARERDLALRGAHTELQDWKAVSEANIRQDAIMRSQAVILGKVTEQVIPFHQAFPYNPKDVRFIGSPIDLIVFDGAAEGEVERIIFLEVKSGNSSLSSRQRRIREAIHAGRSGSAPSPDGGKPQRPSYCGGWEGRRGTRDAHCAARHRDRDAVRAPLRPGRRRPQLKPGREGD